MSKLLKLNENENYPSFLVLAVLKQVGSGQFNLLACLRLMACLTLVQQSELLFGEAIVAYIALDAKFN